MTKEEIRADKAKEVAESLSRAGITPEVAQEILKELDEAEREGKDNVHIRVINIKTSKKKADDSQEEAAEEPKPEPTKEPALEKASEKVAAMVQTNIRFAKAMKDAATEFYQLSCLANEILKENQELRSRLEEKREGHHE